MPILKTDVKIFKSELLTDADNAGGRRTGLPVVDGEANNLFPDVSRIDRVYGKVNLRKIFTGVATDDTQPWLGAHAVVLAPPANPRVRALLFSTDSASDTRLNAKDRVEAYLAQGGDTGWLLYGNHYKGQRAVTFVLRTTDLLPQIGFTYVLLDNAGAGVGLTEFVRVYDLTVVSRSFTTFEQGAERTFTRNIATVDIGIPLSRDWSGNDALYFYSGITIESKVLSTLVADAARYYGIAPLDTAVAANSREVQLESLFENLLPASRSETPLLDLRAVGDQVTIVSTGASRSEIFSQSQSVLTGSKTFIRYFGRGMKPGSVTFTIAVPSLNFFLTTVDNGSGALVLSAQQGLVFTSGVVDYEGGNVTLVFSSGAFTQTVTTTITAVPAVAYTDVSHTDAIDITQANRQFNYTRTLLPLPTPKSISVSYRALGQWYRLTDNGIGQLVPDVAGTGTGTINYASGTAVLTTAAYPDDESAVIWQWGSGVSLARRDGASATFNGLEIDQVVTAGTGMNPGSLQISYLSGGVARVVTDNPDGSLTGNNSGGFVAFGTGRVVFKPNPLPDPNSLITYTYEDGGALTESVMGASFTLATAPVKAGTLVMQVPVISQTNDGRFLIDSVKELRDDGAGNLKNGATTCGTVNYSTGAVTLNIGALTYTRRDYSITASIWQPFLNVPYSQRTNELFNVTYLSNAAPLTSRSTQIACPPLSIDVTSDISDTVVPDSLLFTFGGATYLDREGLIYRSVDSLTNAGTLAGSINYETGAVTLTNWVVGSNAVTVNAMLTRFGQYHVDEIAFRTAATPLLPGLQVRATTLQGDQLIAEADNNGAITGDFTGTLDVDAGVVLLDFGSLAILPDTIRYTGVATKNLPLEAKLLGLNPVRLPSDGRVPLFRVGDLALLHHTALTVLPNPVVADTDYALGRTNIDDIEVRDALGVLVTDTHYMTDLVLGEITFPAPLNLGAYTQPLTVHNRIEFTGLVDDVQINGLVHFNSDIPRAFPLGAYVSGILPFGDLQAASPVFFDQTTWANTWADATTGNATANYNTIVYPIQLKNTHAVTERWALVFTSSTAFNIIGETLGVVGTGNTSTTVAPVNPFTGQPYFTLVAAGFGAGWATNNAIRFNTTASFAPVWVARTILSGSAEYTEDGFRIQARGDSN